MRVFGRKKEDDLILIFDIGSSYVGGSLFFAQKSGQPKIVYSTREPVIIKTRENNGSDSESYINELIYSTIGALNAVASKICASGTGAPKKIFCALHSEWYGSKTRIIKMRHNNSFTFDIKLANNLLKEGYKLLEREINFQYSHKKDRVRIIEFKNINVILDGNSHLQPLSKKTKDIEMVFFASFSPEIFLIGIEGVIKKHFYFSKIQYFSFMLSSFAVARSIFKEKKDFLLLDIGENLTTISLAQEYSLTDSCAFPIGYKSILNEIMTRQNISQNISYDQAKSFLSIYKDKHASNSVINKISPAIDKFNDNWLKEFHKAISSLHSYALLPRDIILTSDEGMEDFFINIIMNDKFDDSCIIIPRFRITPFNLQKLHLYFSLQDDIIANKKKHYDRHLIKPDPFIVIESIYINNFIKS